MKIQAAFASRSAGAARTSTLCAALAMALVANAGAQPQSPATAQPVGDADAGAEFYSTECRGCHSVSIAPTLRGVIDRPVASVASFTGYSEGLKSKGDRSWTIDNLQSFLAAPGQFAPGTLMIKAIEDAQARANIIAYLQTLPPPR